MRDFSVVKLAVNWTNKYNNNDKYIYIYIGEWMVEW